MNEKIKLLDLCCKAGGCSMGYYQAAIDLGLEIEITGVDIEPQPNYPFNFIQSDAVEYFQNNHQNYTHFHASPPCQNYTNSTSQYRKEGKKYRDNLADIQLLFNSCTTKPAVIENVMQAPIRGDIILQGNQFGLKVIRRRKFELINWFALSPGIDSYSGSVKSGDYVSVFGKASLVKVNGYPPCKFRKKTIRETWAYAMGIDWYMSDIELSEAIPPAYTKYIGREFFKQQTA